MKITESWLQAHLVKPRDENGIKVKSPFLELKDGGRISVQASATHYCSPKSDFGPYISAEVFPVDLPPAGRDIIEQLYSGDRQVWGWVAIDQIVELINACGGVKTA